MALFIVTYDLSDRHAQVKGSLKANRFLDKVPHKHGLGLLSESLPDTTLLVEGTSADEVARRFKQALLVDAFSLLNGSPLKRLFVIAVGDDYCIDK
ncbi:hypothetical protein K8640_02710 [Myxococcus sp. XM-1-1-1]|uniref:hypothetical protein n=1 Tax=Myxococcus sp. XM-1-1-1 TaxID=2874602 RepID=UPI001CC12656|nr:hypothetical protein [Myxococcus sp. XM-1-1-1]MBZ4407108.1 hypothetical protein [Myxococcus sp. XM-1-1-1]